MCNEDESERTRQWYLVYTKPSCEFMAQAHLERQGYEVYHPRFVQQTRWRGRWVERIVPLFPRYLFLHLEVGRQAIGPVRSTVGVAGIVRFGLGYAIVPDAVIDGLRSRSDSRTGLHRLSSRAVLERGSKVRIVAGVFDGLEGVLQRESADERVVVLLNLLGQETSVGLPIGLVLPQAAA